LRNNQLIIETETMHSFPIEDINAVLIEDRQTVITTAALSALAKEDVPLYICDEKHIPCGLFVSYYTHSRQAKVSAMQMEMSQPLKKRLWQQIVISKISNQAKCLQLCGFRDESVYLLERTKAVKSGDPDNVEGSAAAFYFRVLFGGDFKRTSDDPRNAGLNYGYSIIRGCMARSVCMYGLLPFLGIHHRSEFNQFNLADDLMEPFRPIVDLYVFSHTAVIDELTPNIKHELISLLNMDILSETRHQSVAYAIELLVQSFRRVSDGVSKGKETLALPELLPLVFHEYE